MTVRYVVRPAEATRCPLCQQDEASAERTRAQIEQARRALATALDTLQELLDR